MIDRIRAYAGKYHMIAEGDTVIAGVSGGADSVCLLLALLELRKEIAFTVRVVHVEHGIRKEAGREDAVFVEQLCRDLEVPFVRYSYDVPGIANERGMSEEEAGRVVRYEAFEQEAGKFVQGKIAVAHNQNDNAETMLHHLIRGSHLTGLAGIAPVRGRIIRPLLCVGREEIEAYLRERGQEYRTDATNFETVYTRNRIRHEILPILQEINPSAISHMVRTADVLRETCEYLDMQAGALAEQAVVYEENEAMIQGEKLREVPALLQNQALYQALARLSGNRKDISEVHVAELRKLFGRQVGKHICLPYGLYAVRDYEGVRIGTRRDFEKEKKETAESPLLETPGFSVRIIEKKGKIQEFPKKKYTKWLDYDKIKGNLCVRSRKPGDYFFLEEQGGIKKLKQYFVDEKIPREQRGRILLVADGDHIVWIVGYRISAYYKITEQTKRILEVQYEKASGCEIAAPAAEGNGGREEDE